MQLPPVSDQPTAPQHQPLLLNRNVKSRLPTVLKKQTSEVLMVPCGQALCQLLLHLEDAYTNHASGLDCDRNRLRSLTWELLSWGPATVTTEEMLMVLPHTYMEDVVSVLNQIF